MTGSVARSGWRLVAGALLALVMLSGCGYSEEEMRARLREIENLQQQLSAEQAQSQQAKRELDEAQARIEQLKQQLKDAGLDIATLSKDIEEKARALEEYKKRAAQFEQIRKRFEALRAKLEGLTEYGLKVTVRKNRLVIQLPGDVLFDTGRETLRKEGEDILLEVAAVIRKDAALNKRHFQVAGHTDSRPMRWGGTFKDNWGLSVMRAREVLAYLVKPVEDGGGGLAPNHWSAAGYGATDPVEPNDTPEHMQANRRCELIVVPDVEEMLDLKSLIK